MIAVRGDLHVREKADWRSGAEDVRVTIYPSCNNTKTIHICCVYLLPMDINAVRYFTNKVQTLKPQLSDDIFLLCGEMGEMGSW